MQRPGAPVQPGQPTPLSVSTPPRPRTRSRPPSQSPTPAPTPIDGPSPEQPTPVPILAAPTEEAPNDDQIRSGNELLDIVERLLPQGSASCSASPSQGSIRLARLGSLTPGSVALIVSVTRGLVARAAGSTRLQRHCASRRRHPRQARAAPVLDLRPRRRGLGLPQPRQRRARGRKRNSARRGRSSADRRAGCRSGQ